MPLTAGTHVYRRKGVPVVYCLPECLFQLLLYDSRQRLTDIPRIQLIYKGRLNTVGIARLPQVSEILLNFKGMKRNGYGHTIKLLWFFLLTVVTNIDAMGQQPFGLVIHGGAGAGIVPGRFTPEREADYFAALEEALRIGYDILAAGGESTDAVEAVIRNLEDCPLFNAGRGAVLTAAGKASLDASIMHGTTRQAGAVAGVTTVKHPISAARQVMVASPHVMMAGEGAEEFAGEKGLELVDNSYFITEEKYADYLKAKQRLEEDRSGVLPEEFKYGTVGCVALDQQGNIVAGTSTGGMLMKLYGRIGDSPVIGAGTYADSRLAGISATGHGEYFIRNVVAYDIVARMDYLGESLQQAAAYVISDKLKAQGGEGGIIGIDAQGNVVMEFNTPGMFRAAQTSTSTRVVQMYHKEDND